MQIKDPSSFFKMGIDQDDETISSTNSAGEMSGIVTYFDADDPIFMSIKKHIDDAEIVISKGLLETKLEDTNANLEKVLGELETQNIKLEEFETHVRSKDDLISSLILERDMLAVEQKELEREVSCLQLKSTKNNYQVRPVFQHKETTRIKQPGSNVCIHSIKVDDNNVIAYESLLSPLSQKSKNISEMNQDQVLLDRDVKPREKDSKNKRKYERKIASLSNIMRNMSLMKCFSSHSCKVLIKPISEKTERMRRFNRRKGKRLKYYPVPPDTFQEFDFIGDCGNDSNDLMYYYLRDLSKQYKEGKHTDEWLIKKLYAFDEVNRARLKDLHQKTTLQNLRIAGLQRELQCASLFSSSCPSIIQTESFSSRSNGSLSSK